MFLRKALVDVVEFGAVIAGVLELANVAHDEPEEAG